ncbi:MAG: DciA family protein [Bdellovibrionales bacterium]
MYLPRTISAAVDKIAREALGKDWSLYAILLDRWPEIVGTEYARVTTPVKISFPPRQKEAQRSGGTLVVRLPKGLAMEFTFKIGQIRQRITDYFGYEPISKIVFESIYSVPDLPASDHPVHDPKYLPALHAAVKDIENEELRQALASFCGAAFRPK